MISPWVCEQFPYCPEFLGVAVELSEAGRLPTGTNDLLYDLTSQ
jgi:hypothetical protein